MLHIEKNDTLFLEITMGTHLHTILEREMDRREFLVFLGVLLLAVTGISGFIKSTSGVLNAPQEVSNGYGSSPYGK